MEDSKLENWKAYSCSTRLTLANRWRVFWNCIICGKPLPLKFSVWCKNGELGVSIEPPVLELDSGR